MNEQSVNATIEPLKIHDVKRNIDWWIDILYHRLNDLLMTDKKNFDIQFEDTMYNFYFPTTVQESKEQAKLRKEFILRLMKVTLNEVIDDIDHEDDESYFNPWVRIDALFAGPDPKDFQLTKSAIDDAMEEIRLEDEKYGTARPLNKGSYQVKMQDAVKFISMSEECADIWNEFLQRKKNTPDDQWDEQKEREILVSKLPKSLL